MINRLWTTICGRNRRYSDARARAEVAAHRDRPGKRVASSEIRAIESDCVVVAVIFSPPAGIHRRGLPDYALYRVSHDLESAELVPEGHASEYGFRGFK